MLIVYSIHYIVESSLLSSPAIDKPFTCNMSSDLPSSICEGTSNAISYISNFQKIVIVDVAVVVVVVVVTLESLLLTWVVPILSSIDSAMMTPTAPPPSVIYYHFVLHRAANKTCNHTLLLNCFLPHTKPYQIKHR